MTAQLETLFDKSLKAAQQPEWPDISKLDAAVKELKALERRLAEYPNSPGNAYEVWQNEKRQAQLKSQVSTPSMDPSAKGVIGFLSLDQWNFILLIFCLMFGTASLPHILTRYYTTTSVSATRYSVFWTLFFVVIFYISVPALAAMVKLDLF
ncbi:MAG: cation acetate symporter, partial [Actinobacteria bacterium]|nr:cation acetate symporter [Actinomycetota bacterium]